MLVLKCRLLIISVSPHRFIYRISNMERECLEA